MKAKRTAVALLGAATMLALLTGCGGEPDMEPTADVRERAEAVYFDYREQTNLVLAIIDEGPWVVGGSAEYGMVPSSSGCDDGWKFDLTRSTTIDPASVDGLREKVAAHLDDAGFTVEGMELGAEGEGSGDVIVRQQGVFSLLVVTFVDNGNVLVKATTACQHGDARELGKALFGDARLAEGYLPSEESPSDPLFFGIAPGDPQFAPAP
ncbi:hypothetical protein GCM10027071_09690 [Microbacterium marinum]